MNEKPFVKKFTKRNEGFTCEKCGTEVKPLVNGFCRNHCPQCLYSKHVDVNPGDRSMGCGGLMKPVRIEHEGRRGELVIHECEKCGMIKRNRLATFDPVQPDSMETIIAITKAFATSVTYK